MINTAIQNQPGLDAQHPVVVQNLTKKFGDFVAVDHVSFSIDAGQIFGWLGPNGAGKTTTIRMLLGLIRPTSGSTHVLGLNSATQTKTIHASVGYMSQQFTLYTDLTVAENIRFYGMVYGLSSRDLRQRQAEIIHMAGLDGREDTLTSSLSGGWKQRLALGCAIIHRPRVVFLDEPTAGVDPISRRAFWTLIYDMAKQGVTVLVTTHYMDEAENCHRLAFIYEGRIIAEGTPTTMKEAQTFGAQVVEIDCAPLDTALTMLREARLFDEVALYGSTIHAIGAEAAGKIPQVQTQLQANGVTVTRIEAIPPSLEDVFIARLRRADAHHEGN